MNKKIILIAFFSLFLLLFWKFQIPNTKFQTIQVGSQKVKIELAKTTEQITKGLGERDQLGSDGMLFVLPSRTVPTFWMKGMRFDLDFVWIDGNRVVDLTENVIAQPGVPEYQLKVYSPKAVVTHVLEMNAGEISKRQIHVGDRISY